MCFFFSGFPIIFGADFCWVFFCIFLMCPSIWYIHISRHLATRNTQNPQFWLEKEVDSCCAQSFTKWWNDGRFETWWNKARFEWNCFGTHSQLKPACWGEWGHSGADACLKKNRQQTMEAVKSCAGSISESNIWHLPFAIWPLKNFLRMMFSIISVQQRLNNSKARNKFKT